MTRELLLELACLFRQEADGITQPYAWPPRESIDDAERSEVNRLVVTASRIAYRAFSMPMPNEEFARLDEPCAWDLRGESK